ncbi:hypothetical protein CLF_102476 [Clonorchis sinensis]|uniref:Uncharacterized protein n=1 Tax=Clonorchis sinensis TaxID=79923 RepID=G7Y809_CLOSI|nr:hypothetical protein CLF_102476 [Clonorchis sinensis]
MLKRLPLGASSANPILMVKPIVVTASCAPERTPKQPTAAPDSSFYSTTADLSTSKGSDSLGEVSLTLKGRPTYVELSALLSVTDDEGETVNLHSSINFRAGLFRRAESSGEAYRQAAACADLDTGECCENRTTTENVKLPKSSSTPSKVASLVVDTIVAQDPDSQSLKPEPENPYLMGAPPKELLIDAATQRSGPHRNTFLIKPRRNVQDSKQTQDCPLNNSKSGRPESGIERATNRIGRNFRLRGKILSAKGPFGAFESDPTVVYRFPPSPPEDDQFLIRTPQQRPSSYHFTHLPLVKLGPASVEDLYRTIVHKVYEADAMFVPKNSARSQMSRKPLKRIRRLLEKRSQLFFKNLTTGDTEDELAYSKMRNRCKAEIRRWNIRKQATILDLARWTTATERQKHNRPGKLGQKPRSCVSNREAVNTNMFVEKDLEGVEKALRRLYRKNQTVSLPCIDRVIRKRNCLLEVVLKVDCTGTGYPVTFVIVKSAQFAPMRKLFGLLREMHDTSTVILTRTETAASHGLAICISPNGPLVLHCPQMGCTGPFRLAHFGNATNNGLVNANGQPKNRVQHSNTLKKAIKRCPVTPSGSCVTTTELSGRLASRVGIYKDYRRTWAVDCSGANFAALSLDLTLVVENTTPQTRWRSKDTDLDFCEFCGRRTSSLGHWRATDRASHYVDCCEDEPRLLCDDALQVCPGVESADDLFIFGASPSPSRMLAGGPAKRSAKRASYDVTLDQSTDS